MAAVTLHIVDRKWSLSQINDRSGVKSRSDGGLNLMAFAFTAIMSTWGCLCTCAIVRRCAEVISRVMRRVSYEIYKHV